ncbi:MAG: N-acetylmuramoyl-L-alanine amidase family protein [Anaerolineae bacterium]
MGEQQRKSPTPSTEPTITSLSTKQPTSLPPTQIPVPNTPTPTPYPTATPVPTEQPPLVALDPGHGGEDLGAVRLDENGAYAYAESDVNLALVLRIRDRLVARDYRVFLTRDGDYEANPEGLDVNQDGVVDHVDDLQLRIDAVNAAGADLLVSVHQNAFYWPDGSRAGDVGGTVTFYNAYRPFADQSERLASLVQEELVAALRGIGHDVLDRGIQVDHELEADPEGGRFLILLGPESERIIRPSEMPGVLSETLFMTHDRESELLQDPEVLDVLAEAYTIAIERYFQEDRQP